MATTIKLLNTGLAILTNRIIGSGTEPKYIGTGTGTTAAAVTQTDLVTPTNDARVSGTGTRYTQTATNDGYQVVGTVSYGTTAAITELATFDAAGTGTPPTGGNAFIRAAFDAINVTGGTDSVQYTVKVYFVSA